MQLNKALLGFLSHCGYAHGGNGYEGVAFLIEQFEGSGLADPGDPQHGIDLAALAARYVQRYAEYKSNKKNEGSLDIQKVPGVNHPVFKDKPVNHDPREVYIARQAGRARRDTTSSTTTTVRWCRPCTTPACRAPCTASTSTRSSPRCC